MGQPLEALQRATAAGAAASGPFAGLYTVFWIMALAAAMLTAFYMTRMIAMTFFGKKRWEDDAHPHESPSVMTIPLVLLALGSVFLGMALLFWGDIKDWLKQHQI